MSAFGQIIIHPFLRRQDLSDFLEQLIPELNAMDIELPHQPRKAKRRELVRRLTWRGPSLFFAVCLLFFYLANRALSVSPESPFSVSTLGGVSPEFVVGSITVVGFSLLFCLLVASVICAVFGALWWFRDSGAQFNKNFALIRIGGIKRKSYVMPRTKAQAVELFVNPWQDHLGLCTLRIHTAIKLGQDKVKLVDIEQSAGRSWLEWAE